VWSAEEFTVAYTVAYKGEACSAVHLAHDPFRVGVHAFDPTVVERQDGSCLDGVFVEVEVEAAGEGVQVAQIARADGCERPRRFSPTALTPAWAASRYRSPRPAARRCFDIVFETVGGPVLDASFEAVRTYTGHVALVDKGKLQATRDAIDKAPAHRPATPVNTAAIRETASDLRIGVENVDFVG
jgi:hypothetical protein